MKLSIYLQNPLPDADAVTQALRHTDICVAVDNERIVLTTESLVPATFAPGDAELSYAAWQRINELIAIVNGSAQIEGGALHGIALANVAYEDGEGKQQHLPGVVRMRGVLPALRSTPPDPSEFISVALRDRAAAKALRLVSRELDWCNLYRIFEVVTGDVGESEIVASGWASETEIDAFTASANNESVTGDDSRHGRPSNGTPRNTVELPDAQHVIKRIVRGWLSSKVTPRSPSVAQSG